MATFDEIRDSINSALRDNSTQGVPASGDHDPVKQEIRAALQLIVTAIDDGGFSEPPDWAADLADVLAQLETADSIVSSAAGHASDAATSADLAQAALTNLGVNRFANTKAAAVTANAGWTNGDVALVWADETYGGARTYYVRESGSLVYKALGPPLTKFDPAANVMLFGSTGASLTPGASAGDHDGDSIVVVSKDFSNSASSAYAIAGIGPGILNSLTTGDSLWAGAYQALHRATTAVAVTATGTDCGFNVTSGQRLSLYGRHVMFTGDGSVDFTGADGVIIGESIAPLAEDWTDFCIGGQNNMVFSPGTGSYQFTIWGTKAVLRGTMVQSDVTGYESAHQATSLVQAALYGMRTCHGVEFINYTVSFGAGGFYHDAVVNSGVTVANSTGIGVDHAAYLSGSEIVAAGTRALAHSAPTVRTGVMGVGYRAGDVAGGATALADGDYVFAMNYLDTRRIMWGNSTSRTHNIGGTLAVDGYVKPKSYTVGTVPSASTSGAGAIIYVSNEAGGAIAAFSDGTDWRRVSDRTVIS